MSVEQIAEAVRVLPSDARALLVDCLVGSQDPLTDPDVRDGWAVESLRRLIAHEFHRQALDEFEVTVRHYE